MQPTRINVAVVGLGFGAEFVPIYRAHPNVGHVAICDPDQNLLTDVGERYAIDCRFSDLRTRSSSRWDRGRGGGGVPSRRHGSSLQIVKISCPRNSRPLRATACTITPIPICRSCRAAGTAAHTRTSYTSSSRVSSRSASQLSMPCARPSGPLPVSAPTRRPCRVARR